jgi:hypothetical protein
LRGKLLLLLLGVLFSIHTAAQDNSRVEVFGGYSLVGYSVFQRYSGRSALNKYNGWDASVMGRVAPHLGLEADFGGGFSGDYGIGTSKIYSYMGGPRVLIDRGKARFHGHVLFGGMTFSSSSPAAISSTSFALAAGGGADYWFSRRVGVQVFEADYIDNNNVLGPSHADFRISTGVVFRF